MKNYTGMDLPASAEDMERHFAGGFDGYDPEIERYAKSLLPEYLFIRKGTKKEIGFCSHCGTEMNLRAIWPDEYAKWKHGDEINCPHCGRRVRVITRKMTELWDKGFFYWYEKSAADRNSLVCRGIAMVRGWPDGDPRRPYEKIWTDSAILFSYGKGATMAIPNNGGSGGRYRLAKRVCSRRDAFTGSMYRSAAEIGDPVGCIRAAVKGTPFRWSQWHKLEKFRRGGTDAYIRVFERFSKYRAWEWLTKMGIAHLLMEYAENNPQLWTLFNMRGKTVDAIFRCHLTKDDKVVLREGPVTEEVLRAWMQWKSCKSCAALRDVQDFWPRYWRTARLAEESTKVMMQRITPAEWIDYEKKQGGRDITDYADYIGECLELGMDLDDRRVLWPKDLGAAHRQTGERLQLKKDAVMEAMYDDRRESMEEKYDCESQRAGLCIVVPETLEDLIREGEQQHNCVGGYMRRVAEGETDVVFLRRIRERDRSYITVEVDPRTGTVRQAREKYNQEVQDIEAKAFLRRFEQNVRRKLA